MNSKFNRIQSSIIMLASVIVAILIIVGIIPSIIPFFACIVLMFVMGNIIVPIIDGKKAKKAYDESLGNTSATLLIIKRTVFDQTDRDTIIDSYEETTRKFKPKRLIYPIYVFAIILVFAPPLLYLIGWILHAEIDSTTMITLYLIEIAAVIFFYVFIYMLIKPLQVIMSETHIKAYMRPNLDLFKKGNIESVLYSSIMEVNIKRNKYFNYKNEGVIFELILNDDSKKIFTPSILSEKQRQEIIHILQEKIK